jgi:glutathione S-transferase
MSRGLVLIGQYDSPFARRVAISLRLLGFHYAHDTRSIFGDFDALRLVNPAGRIPALILPDGETLIDSAAILDWLDESVGPERALVPAKGPERRRALRLVALATGAIEKIGATVYERLIRPSAYRWPDWIARCETQGMGAVAALSAEEWPQDRRLGQAEITTACLVRYIRHTRPELMPAGRFARLEALSARCEALPEFSATDPGEHYGVPRGD